MDMPDNDEQLNETRNETVTRLSAAFRISREEASDLVHNITYEAHVDPTDPRFTVFTYRLPNAPKQDGATESFTGIRALTTVVSNALAVAKGFYDQRGWPSTQSKR